MPVALRHPAQTTPLADDLAWIDGALATLLATYDDGTQLWWQAGSSTATGTLAVTDGTDTLAAAGSPVAVAVLAVTDATDTLAAAGTTAVVAVVATTDGTDTLSAAGTTVIVGVLAVTDGTDILAASGVAPPSGTLAVTDATDTLTAIGVTVIVGVLAVTDGTDTLVAAPGDTAAYRLDYRETSGVLDYTEGQRIMSTAATTWKRTAERPGVEVWWRDRRGNLVNLAAATLTLRIGAPGSAALLTKTAGLVGAAGSGTSDTGTPNLTITWASGELNLAPATWSLEITARVDGVDRVLTTRVTILDTVT